MSRRLGKLILLAFVGVALLAGFIGATNWWVLRAARGHLHTDLANLPANDVAVVLGTSPKLKGKRSNPFFEARMDAAAALVHGGKVQHLLVSGDNGRSSYDEPTAMKEALVLRGVPAEAISLDYAGFRTLDSMARAKKVFNLDRCTIVTDDFHQPRALFLAAQHGLNAEGFIGRPVPWKWSKKTRIREIGSRVKAWLDVYILRTEPQFYGPKVELRLAARA
jgi:SanA protein